MNVFSYANNFFYKFTQVDLMRVLNLLNLLQKHFTLILFFTKKLF